jgi:hypothetical protein
MIARTSSERERESPPSGTAADKLTSTTCRNFVAWFGFAERFATSS